MWELVFTTTGFSSVDGLEHSVRPASCKSISTTFWSSAPSAQLPGVIDKHANSKAQKQESHSWKEECSPLSRWVRVIRALPPGARLWWYHEGPCFWSSQSQAANSIWHPQLLAKECLQSYSWSLSLRAHLRHLVHSQPSHHVQP